MNRIQRIQTFLQDYQDLNPYLKDICRGSYEHYKLELIKELVRCSKQPYPNEYLEVS